ncbi:hypothetical protein [Microcoleus sp. D2_18a_B4]
MPVPQENLYFVEQAEKPVPKQVIENGATYEFEPIRAKGRSTCCNF